MFCLLLLLTFHKELQLWHGQNLEPLLLINPLAYLVARVSQSWQKRSPGQFTYRTCMSAWHDGGKKLEYLERTCKNRMALVWMQKPSCCEATVRTTAPLHHSHSHWCAPIIFHCDVLIFTHICRQMHCRLRVHCNASVFYCIRPGFF